MYHLSNRHTVCVSPFPLSLLLYSQIPIVFAHFLQSRIKSTKHAKILSGLTFIKWNLFLLYFLYVCDCDCVYQPPSWFSLSLSLSHVCHTLCACVHVTIHLYIQLSFSISPLWHFVNKFARKLPASIAHTYSVSVVFVAVVKHETGFDETNSINRQIHTHTHIHTTYHVLTRQETKKNTHLSAAQRDTKKKHGKTMRKTIYRILSKIIYFNVVWTKPLHIYYVIDMPMLLFCQRWFSIEWNSSGSHWHTLIKF